MKSLRKTNGRGHILNLLKNDLSHMKNAYGVKKLALFGSSARGSQKRTRDIDILVEFKTGCKTFDNYMDLKFFLEDMFRRKIDLVIKDALRRELKPSIMSDAIYV